MADLLKNATEEQRVAILHDVGPAVVSACPGSGKTFVITRRIAHLILKGCSPHNIVGITFTNKAANVMKERITTLVPNLRPRSIALSTFHSFCVSLMRANPKQFRVSRNFGIADEGDVKEILKQSIARISEQIQTHGRDDDDESINAVRKWISDHKNVLRGPQDIDQKTEKFKKWIPYYREYQKRLAADYLLDFDDLIMRAVQGIQRNSELQKWYNQNIHYLLVDEWQDTNFAQYELVRLLTEQRGNVFVCGDTDQSIYYFRGADIRNTERFYKAFPETKTYLLQMNFRSTPGIAQIANNLIQNNKRLHEKLIVPFKRGGDFPLQHHFSDSAAEANFIINTITGLVMNKKAEWRDFAVIYRIRSLSRVVEDSAVQHNVPYRVVGSLSFYNRAAIKDILAYARLLVNPKEDVSFTRIVNKPNRSIGPASLASFVTRADQDGVRLLRALGRKLYNKIKMMGPAQNGFDALRRMYAKWRTMDKTAVAPIIKSIMQHSGYLGYVNEIKDDKRRDRVNEDLYELLAAAAQFDENYGNKAGLGKFLEHTALMQQEEQDVDPNKVMLLTAHAAKGMEFKNVFVIGCVEGVAPLFPRIEAGEENEKEIITHHYEEERRVFFVAVTRAEDRLWLTLPMSRFAEGTPRPTTASRFLAEAGVPEAVMGNYNRQNDLLRSAEMVKPYRRHRNKQDGICNAIIQQRLRRNTSRESETDLQIAERERLRRIATKNENSGPTKPSEQDGN